MKWPTVGELATMMEAFRQPKPYFHREEYLTMAAAALAVLKDLEQEEAKEDSLDKLTRTNIRCTNVTMTDTSGKQTKLPDFDLPEGTV